MLQIPIFDYGVAENNTVANKQQQNATQFIVKQHLLQ